MLNLTQLNLPGQGLTNNISAIAPGYVVTSTGVSLGLPMMTSSAQSLGGPRVALTSLTQPTGTVLTYANSTYAQQATKFDWQTPPMLMQVSNNAAGLNGNYYGNVVVDTGLAVGIITSGTTCTIAGTQTGCVNQALVQSATQSATPTRIAITLGGAGASGNPAAQFIYVFQGVCPNGASGCGPPPPKRL
jgi:hypothetical protein